MDPLLQQKTEELYAKLSKARRAGAEITPDDIEAWMRRETGGKYGLSDAQWYVNSLTDVNGRNLAGSAGQGATFNFLDELIGKLGGSEGGERLRDKAFSGRHPIISGGMKLVGALTAPLAAAAIAPEAAGGTAAGGLAVGLRSALAGAGAGGLAAAGASEGSTPSEVATDAAKGAGAGFVMGPALTAGTRAVAALGGGIRNALANPDALAVSRAGRMMPEALELQAARHEMLAPGTFIPAAASEDATQIATGVGASPRAALSAIEQVRAQAAKITQAKEDVGAAYDQVANAAGPLKVDNELRDLLHSVGEDYMGGTIGADKLFRLRTLFREKAGAASKSGDRHMYGQFVKGMTAWMEKRIGGLSELDSRFAFLSRSEENANKLLDVLEKTNISHGKAALFGAETGSVGGHPSFTSPRGAVSSALGRLASALTPGKSARADAVARQLLQPADAAQVARLAAARAAAMQPTAPHPFANFAFPVGSTDAIMSLFHSLTNPLPEQIGSDQ